jgi:CRISPR-associated protein Cas2
VFKLMHGYGRWLQLSVFQCRLSARRRAELAARLDALIHYAEDHVVILDLGPADQVDLRVESFGKSYAAPQRRAIVIGAAENCRAAREGSGDAETPGSARKRASNWTDCSLTSTAMELNSNAARGRAL